MALMGIWQASAWRRGAARMAGACAAAALVCSQYGCARDVNQGEDQEILPIEVKLSMSMLEPPDNNTWYFMVFNFGSSPSTAANTAPLDFISNEQRGRNWELYIGYHRDKDLGDQFVTLQRPRLPWLLKTAEGPVDCVAASFNPTTDAFTDIAVACQAADKVQLIKGREVVVRNNLFFEDAVDIDSGPNPIRLFNGDFDDDSDQDLIVVYAGDTGTGPQIRYLVNDGTGVFAAQPPVLLSETPVDAVLLDLNPPDSGTGTLDLAVLTVPAGGGTGNLRIFQGAGLGVFTAGQVLPAGENPVDLASGELNNTDPDLAVANAGPPGGNGSISWYLGNGDGSFNAQTPLSMNGTGTDPQVPNGRATGVSLGAMFGTGGDLVYTYTDGSGKGHVGTYLKELADATFAPEPIVTDLSDPAVALATIDTGNDNKLDALVVNGIPGTSKNNLIIQRGQTQTVGGNAGQFEFIWDDFPITYPTGTEPARIVPADINADSRVDLLLPCSGAGDNGNAIAVYYALGKDNFTNIDIYWTDFNPQPLASTRWFVQSGSGVFGTQWVVTIDPNEFFDLTLETPDNFIVDFMTATTGIALDSNPDQLGEIREHLTTPVAVPMQVGFYTDEQALRLATTPTTPGTQDIISWTAEVN